MKKLSLVLVALIALQGFIIAKNAQAAQNSAPPLLMQKNTIPAMQSPGAEVPPSPGLTAVPGTPPPPLPPPLPGPAGIPVVQAIPVQTLLAGLPQAVVTAEKINKLLAPGKIWIMHAPAGEVEIKGGVLYQGVVVAVIHFNPVNGSILPLGINPHTYQNNTDIKSIGNTFSAVIGNLKILHTAEFMEPEACWSFPVAKGNKIVAHIKIYYDGIHVVQDYAANQEMIFYGQ